MGVAWRAERDKHQDHKIWKSGRGQFVRKVCEKWQLPSSIHVESQAKGTPSKHVPEGRKHQDHDDVDMGALELKWQTETRRFCMVVDCQALQRIICGHTPLLNDNYRPLFSHATNNIMEVVRSGWLPTTNESDPVIWTRRDNNKLADYLCNWTMDVKKTSWRNERPKNPHCPGDSNVLVFSDGGTRPECSASAWVLGTTSCIDGNLQFTPMITAGIFFENPVKSFMAETVAFEQACRELELYLRSREDI